jgi:hypothetical protein
MYPKRYFMIDTYILKGIVCFKEFIEGDAKRRNWMSSLKRWRRIGEGQFHKWETTGDELEGIWRGAHEGRFGPLGTLETSEALVTFPCRPPSGIGCGG